MEQIIFNLLIDAKKANSLYFKLLLLLRRFLLVVYDSPVQYRYHNFIIKFPFSHDFPLNLKQHPTYSQNLSTIAKHTYAKYANLSVIDVGANVGDSVAIVHKNSAVPVLCIEGNPKFIPLLIDNTKQFANITIENCFVGEETSTVKPVNNLGTAYLQVSDDGQSVKTISSVINTHTAFKKSKLLKIDTDGFDNKIIRGSKDFIEESKPIIFFEYDPYFLSLQGEKGTDIFDFLNTLGYPDMIVYDNIGRYMFTLKTDNKNLIAELHHYFNQNGAAYMDICAFHEEDLDIMRNLIAEELQ